MRSEGSCLIASTKGSSLYAFWMHWYVSWSGSTLASKVWVMALSSYRKGGRKKELSTECIFRESSKINLY